MFNKHSWRNIVIAAAGAAMMALASVTSAQWGTNTSPCPTHCAPASPWWGYVQTHWNRWPGAVYPDMVGTPTKTGEEIPAPGVNLPNPSNETDIRTTPPATNNKEGGSGAAVEETPHDQNTEPTPAKSNAESAPLDLSAPKQAPGAEPPMNNPFNNNQDTGPSGNALPSGNAPSNVPSSATPPSNDSAPPPAPSGNSKFIPKPRLHAPSTKGIAVSTVPSSMASNNVEENGWAGPRGTKPDAADSASIKPLRLKITADDFARPISPDQEPDLIVPSLASRPLPSLNFDAPLQRSAATGNPLRADAGARGAVSATSNAESTKTDTNQISGVAIPASYNGNANSASSTTGYTGSAAPANPLR